MAFATSFRHSGAALLAIASASLLLWFGNGMEPYWPLMWFAPLPVLLFALRSSWQSAAIVAVVSWLIGCLNMWHYLHVLGAAPSVWIAVFSILSLVFTVDVLFFRTLVRAGFFWQALLVFPSIWVSYEFARNLGTPHGTAGSIAYSQLNFLPFLQLASLTGPWGMSFLLMLFPAALAVGLHLYRSHPKQALRVTVAATGIVGVTLIFGVIRLRVPQDHKKIPVGLVAADPPPNEPVAEDGAATDRLFGNYATEAKRLSARGARIIVLPEKLGVLVDPRTTNANNLFQSLADTTKSTTTSGIQSISLLVVTSYSATDPKNNNLVSEAPRCENSSESSLRIVRVLV